MIRKERDENMKSNSREGERRWPNMYLQPAPKDEREGLWRRKVQRECNEEEKTTKQKRGERERKGWKKNRGKEKKERERKRDEGKKKRAEARAIHSNLNRKIAEDKEENDRVHWRGKERTRNRRSKKVIE